MNNTHLEYGLLGERLGHSYSPAIHRQLGDYDYQLVELTPEEVGPFLQKGDFQGLNVTMPYKKTVMDFCAELSPAAQRIGSVNTILRRPDGTLYGDNTDYDGFLYLLQSAGAQVQGKKVLVLGSGGSSLTVRTVLADLGAGNIVTISRSGPDNYTNLDRHRDADYIVNTTPVGMYPNNGAAPVDLEQFPNCKGVFDLIYNPAKTQLLLDAERRGMLFANGLGMLVAQAKAAAERFSKSYVENIEKQVGECSRSASSFPLSSYKVTQSAPAQGSTLVLLFLRWRRRRAARNRGLNTSSREKAAKCEAGKGQTPFPPTKPSRAQPADNLVFCAKR